MRRVKLANGEEVLVGVQHKKEQMVKIPSSNTRRVSEVFLKREGEEDSFLVGRAIVHPNDNFSRKVGRKLAVCNLLQKMRERFEDTNRGTWKERAEAKRERRRVFEIVMPEFSQKEDSYREA